MPISPELRAAMRLRRQRLYERLLLWLCKRLPYEIRSRREVLIIHDWGPEGRWFHQEIPRDIAEAIGVGVFEIDEGRTRWISVEERALLRQQPEYREVLCTSQCRGF